MGQAVHQVDFHGAMMAILQRINAFYAFLGWGLRLFSIGGLLAVGYYLADRVPPFEVLSVEPAQARPGEPIIIRAKVRRDIHRHCSASMSRYIFDVGRVRYFMDAGQYPHQVIADMEAATPGELSVGFIVPAGSSPGPAMVVAALEYECNQVHFLAPIKVRTVMPFTILPP